MGANEKDCQNLDQCEEGVTILVKTRQDLGLKIARTILGSVLAGNNPFLGPGHFPVPARYNPIFEYEQV